MSRTTLVLTVEPIAGSGTPEDACRDLEDLADRVGIAAATMLNGEYLIAFPLQPRGTAFRTYQRAIAIHGRVCP